MNLPRHFYNRLRLLFDHFPVVVVSGARQVGKTTLLHELFLPDADYVVFDPVVPVAGARDDPDLFLDNRRTPLILDEIQYAPEVVAAIKRRVDRDRKPGRYLLTGSQQWGVLRTLAESLAGRAVFLDLEAFTLSEISGRGDGRPWLVKFLESSESFFSTPAKRLPRGTPFFEQLWRGFMPGVQGLPREVVPSFHEGYHRTYIERDVRLVAEVSNRDLFEKFTRLAAALSAQEVNKSEFGREIGITPPTAGAWLGVLRDTYQWHEVPAFSRNAVKRISSRPKGYYADTGALCRAQSIGSPEALSGHPLLGPVFETAGVAELRKQAALLPTPPRFHHWRTHSGAEVDLLVEHDGVFYAVEFKSKSNPGKSDAKGILAFRDAYPDLKHGIGLIISPCEASYAVAEKVMTLPWDLA